MSYLIRNPELERMVARLAALRGKSKVDVIRDAVRNEIAREERGRSLKERLRDFHARSGVAQGAGRIDWDELKKSDDALSGL